MEMRSLREGIFCYLLSVVAALESTRDILYFIFYKNERNRHYFLRNLLPNL